MSNVSGRFGLNRKVALVTGAAGLLGSRFCHGLAEAGASIAAVDQDEEASSKLAAEIHATYGVPAAGIKADVGSAKDVDEMVHRVTGLLGPINILVNNAAKKGDLAAFFMPFEDYDPVVWREVMSVNLDGMFLVAKAVGGHMARNARGGSIVQISSIYGSLAPDQRIYAGSEYLGRAINTPAVYSASKAGVEGLTRFLASYWASKGIRVNTLSPGGVRSGQNQTFEQQYAARVPLGRMAEPDEMVGALLFLASEASSYVTGQNLLIDGGLSVW